MAWKRGTENNIAGEIRKGHIKEFLQPSSKDLSVSVQLRVIDHLSKISDVKPYAYINFNCLPRSIQSFVDSEQKLLYLHAHEHPVCIVTCTHGDSVPMECIELPEALRLNSRVCVGENEEWTVYQGDTMTFDAREAVIGNTEIRPRIPGLRQPSTLDCLVLDIRYCTHGNFKTKHSILDARLLRPQILKYFETTVVTVGETYSYRVKYTTQCDLPVSDDICLVLTIAEVREMNTTGSIDFDLTENFEDDNGVDSIECYRGLVTTETSVYLCIESSRIDCGCLELTNSPQVPSTKIQKDLILVHTCDNECFPVKRRLLRPCLALTSVVQSGRGKYSVHSATNCGLPESMIACESHPNSCHVEVDACTFDRVLLYLEHEARSEPFKFDPLLVTDLHAAAVKLQVLGLIETCERVLGSFQERVRKTPIRWQEVVSRNEAGRAVPPSTKRGDTWLVMNGMVLDITRWLDEHPGGSTIIPNQALNTDCTVLFEIYHASTQSFLYLKEFYLGELALEDLHSVPQPERGQPSEAFLEQLKKVTSWRVHIESYENVIHKSF